MAEGAEIRDVIYRIRVEADPRSKAELGQFTQQATQAQRGLGKAVDDGTAKIRQQQEAIKKVTAEYNKSMNAAKGANAAVVESSKQALGGVTALARGMVLLGVSGEKDLQKALQTLAKFEAAAQVARGLIETTQGLTRTYQAYRASVQATAAAHATLAAAERASGRAGVGGAAKRAGGGTFLAGGLGAQIFSGVGAVIGGGLGLGAIREAALTAGGHQFAGGPEIGTTGIASGTTGGPLAEHTFENLLRPGARFVNRFFPFVQNLTPIAGDNPLKVLADLERSEARTGRIQSQADVRAQFERTETGLNARQEGLDRQIEDRNLNKQRDVSQERLDKERQILRTMEQETQQQQQQLDAARGRFQSAAEAFALADPLSQQRAVRLKGRLDAGGNLTAEELGFVRRFTGEGSRENIEDRFRDIAEGRGFGAFQTQERDIIAAGAPDQAAVDRQRGVVDSVAGELRGLVQELVRRQEQQTEEMFRRLQDAIREEREAAQQRANNAGFGDVARRAQAAQAAQGAGDFGV